ncbi:flagellar basal body-associated FliL family protein [Albidovulum sp.]|uniref:flagellar basal body-associated FliL family protein n=1 Tax=Albidovulum sp. TaxID=1872424 RepID=UPI0039B93152
MRRLLPLFLALLGLLAGGGAGFLLRPPAEETAPTAPCGDAPGTADNAAAGHPAGATDPEAPPAHEYVKLNNQFVVPVVEAGEVAALVVLSISLEVTPGMTEQVYAREPRLRDGFLRVLFDHANAGGFGGAFTQSNNMEILRGALLEVARKPLGAAVSDVLIIDIVRQDG